MIRSSRKPINSRQQALRWFVVGGLVCQCLASQAADFDLRPHWDDRTPLANPDKGWYHHYPDNHIDKYRIAQDSDLTRFPGMDHLYIRLSWAYLEPKEGEFNWTVIDDLVHKWTNHGLGIAFRISCKETSTDRSEQQYATPRWVQQAGAKGDHYRMGKRVGPDGPWEPEFDDPVFLEKLDHFLTAFAARYDGRPWVRYVDIGSLGDWGEGHTWAGSRLEYGYEARKRHVDLYLRHFQKSQLVISDDFVFAVGGPEDRKKFHQYVLDHGISYRDDSILVDGYLAGVSRSFTVRSPEFFADAWRRTPTVLELEHYGAVKRAGNWLPTPGSSLAKFGGGQTGSDFLRGAMGLLHATYLGYHGDAPTWLADNPALTVELLNRCGYWFFPHLVRLPPAWQVGRTNSLEITWENRGVAVAYQNYQLELRLEGPQRVELATPARNRSWMPSSPPKAERYEMVLPPMQTGRYALKFRLRSLPAQRNVLVALQRELLDAEGYYRLAELQVEP